jgi:crotonobetainyl-CoA:carnitine CoA-transferase CaiB-like acyl-CoA transferase
MRGEFGVPRDLEGLLVVALEQAVAAPYASGRLADAGARVIKVERPEGDFARGYDRAVNGLSAYFAWLNRGKESVALDIKDGAQAAILRRMLARADVFIQNLAPGAAARAGFGPDDLWAANPGLVHVSISGYGEEGPYRSMKAYDLLVQAETGLCWINGSPETPSRVGVSVCDIAAGMYAHQQILQALIARGRTGKGRAIQVSLFDGMADWMAVPYLQSVYGGKVPPRAGLSHPTIAPYGAYETRDGRLLLISIQNEREWARLCADVLGLPDLARDPRYLDVASRVANRAALDATIAEAFAREDQDALAARLTEAGIGWGRVRSPVELPGHPQFRVVEVESEAGPVRLPAPPGVVLGEGPPALGPIPRLDEHGERIRAEFGP